MNVDPRELRSIATIVLGYDVWDAPQVEIEHLGEDRPASATAGLYRVRSIEPEPWSAVVKVLSGRRAAHPRWLTSEDPNHWYWWRREEVAYSTGLLDRLTGGLRAPRYLNVFARTDGTIALWLEDVTAPPAETWTMERYGTCARHLARAQWAFVLDPPDDVWLARDFLRGYLDRHADIFDDVFETDLVRRAKAAFQGRDRLLASLDTLPTTLCHNDFHAFNLFGEPDGDSIAVDWSFVGLGPLASDAGAFAPDAVLDFGAPADRIEDLFAAVEDGYLQGLSEAGFDGDTDAVRLGLRIAGGLKFAWVAAAVASPDDAQRGRWEQRYERPADVVHRDWTTIASFVLDLADEARRRLT